MTTSSVHSYSARAIDGSEHPLSEYAGKVLLVVNVASQCGLTPQYEGLEKLYRAYKDRGLVVLGFPCNQFAGQEPGTEPEILKFCELRYDVTFPLFSKIDVNGDHAHPLYAHMKAIETQPDGKGDVSWNFAKFLVDREGNVIARFKPKEDPGGERLTAAVLAALG